jgi:UrcA family protein
MIAIRHVAIAAIACACLSSVASTQDREPVTARVRYADLNLSSSAGRAALKSRIRGAAEIACPEMGNSIAEKMDTARCRDEMMKDGALQAAALSNSADQRLALAEPR